MSRPVAGFVVDEAGGIVGWSAGAERLLGYAEAEARSLSLTALCDPLDATLWNAGWRSGWRDALAHEGAVMLEVRCRRKDGARFLGWLILSALGNRLAASLVEAFAESDRDRALATVAHDLRQPIAVVDNAVYLLRRAELPASARAALDRVSAATQTMEELAGALLDVGCAALGVDTSPLEPLEVGELVRGLAEDARLTHPDRPLALALDAGLHGRWPRARLRRILQNLIQNAVSHAPPGAAVEICCRKAAGAIVFTTQNAMTEQAPLEPLFEPFRRSGGNGQVGLGLFIARELARSLGGEVAAAASGGEILFSLFLPTETGMTFNRQRRHPRLPLDGELQIGAAERVLSVRGRDISLRGLAFYSDVELGVSESVRVISTGELGSLSVVGTVRHCRREEDGWRVGVEFIVDLTDGDLDVLRRPRRASAPS